MAFADVKRRDRERGAAGEGAVQSLLASPGAVAVPGGVSIGGGPGAVGDVSDAFRDDPTVNSIVALPSQREAEQYSGKKPSFYGVQRPGDWQRTVQRQMAADIVGSREGLGRLIGTRVDAARQRGGDFTASNADVARAMGAGYTGTQENLDKREGELQRRLAQRFRA